MQTYPDSASAYAALAELTEQYEVGQVRLQELRVLTRALRVLAATYGTEARIEEPMGQAIAHMGDAASVERSRLYQESSRLVAALNRINGLIQTGTYNE